jgi:hypothetical protein
MSFCGGSRMAGSEAHHAERDNALRFGGKKAGVDPIAPEVEHRHTQSHARSDISVGEKKNPAELRRVFMFGQRIAPAAHLASAADQNVSSMYNILATNRFHGAFSKTAYQSRRNIDGGFTSMNGHSLSMNGHSLFSEPNLKRASECKP